MITSFFQIIENLLSEKQKSRVSQLSEHYLTRGCDLSFATVVAVATDQVLSGNYISAELSGII
jgi:hypothetical protein